MASFSTFSDPLTATTQNTSIWNASLNFGTNSWAAQGWTVTNGANYTGYGGIQTTSFYDLTGTSVFVNIANVGNQSLVSCESVPLGLIDSGGTNKLFWYVNGGNISAYKTVAGAQAQVGSSATYNSTTHKWLRIREASGTIYWDYSSDGLTWTNFTSVLTPITITALSVNPSLGTYSNEASSTTMKINSFSTAPVVAGSAGQFFAAL